MQKSFADIVNAPFRQLQQNTKSQRLLLSYGPTSRACESARRFKRNSTLEER